MDCCIGAEAEPALGFLGRDAQRHQQTVAGGREIDGPNRGCDPAALVLGKGLSLELRLEQATDFGKWNVDRQIDADAPLLHLRDKLQLSGKRTIRFGLVWYDPRLRLHADSERKRLCADSGLRGQGTRWTKLDPEIGQASRGAERDRAAHLLPFTPRGLFHQRTVAYPRLQRGDLLVDRAFQVRLHLLR